MSPLEAQLLQLLKDRSFKRGTFQLASGDVSDYYIDGRTSAVFSEGAWLIGECIFEAPRISTSTRLAAWRSARPLTTAAVISYHLHGKRWKDFGSATGPRPTGRGN